MSSLVLSRGLLINFSFTFLTVLIVFVGLNQSLYAAGISIVSKCNPVAVQTCGLPFPSDLFRNTAGKLNFSDKVWDRTVDGDTHELLPLSIQYPENFQPAKVFNGSSGFSPLGPILFELPDFPIQELMVPTEEFLVVFNRDTMQKVPMVVSMSKVANPTRDFRQPKPVVIAYPRSRLDFGGRYIAVLLKNGLNSFSPEGYSAMEPTTTMQSVLNGDATWLLQWAYDPVLKKINQLGIAKSDILSATFFTVKKEKEVTDPLLGMVAQATANKPFNTGFTEIAHLGSEETGNTTLKSQMSLVNFRSRDGGIYPPYEPLADGDLNQAEFILTLPRWDSSLPIPIALWSHGLANEKERTKTGFIQNDDMGIASLAIDHPNHGSRVVVWDNKQPAISTMVRSPYNISHFLGMWTQSVIDHAVLAEFAHSVLPNSLNRYRQNNPGLPELDGNRLVFRGLSLGGMVGVAVGATAPHLKGAFIVNGAGSLAQIISESVLWDGNTSMLIPPNANGAEATFVLAMMQHVLDIGDGNNFAHLYRQENSERSEIKLGMLYALGDGSVPNSTSLATAELVELPLLREVLEPVPQLPNGTDGIDIFADGFGVFQSGYGLDLADRTLEETKAFDDELTQPELDLDVLDTLSDQWLAGTAIGESVDTLLSTLITDEETEDLDSIIDNLYAGDLEAFLTHFNRNSLAANLRKIEWHCDVLELQPDRCEQAVAIAVEKDAAAQAEANSTEAEPNSMLTDLLGGETIRVEVADNTAGAIDVFIGFILLLSLMRRRAEGIKVRSV